MRSPCGFVLVVHSCHNFLVLLFIKSLQIQLQSAKKFGKKLFPSPLTPKPTRSWSCRILFSPCVSSPTFSTFLDNKAGR